MGFTFRETQMVKGMLARGDKQHDIAAYFGVNGGRVAEVSSGTNDYPNVTPTPENLLPPAGPYVNGMTIARIENILHEAIDLIVGAGNVSDEIEIAICALRQALTQARM